MHTVKICWPNIVDGLLVKFRTKGDATKALQQAQDPMFTHVTVLSCLDKEGKGLMLWNPSSSLSVDAVQGHFRNAVVTEIDVGLHAAQSQIKVVKQTIAGLALAKLPVIHDIARCGMSFTFKVRTLDIKGHVEALAAEFRQLASQTWTQNVIVDKV